MECEGYPEDITIGKTDRSGMSLEASAELAKKRFAILLDWIREEGDVEYLDTVHNILDTMTYSAAQRGIKQFARREHAETTRPKAAQIDAFIRRLQAEANPEQGGELIWE